MPDDPNKKPDGGGFFSNLESALTPSPGLEQFLAAVPLLVGSFEEAKGRPAGAMASTLGELLMMHGQSRSRQAKQLGDIQALQKLVQGFDQKKAPVAAQLFQQLQPQLQDPNADLDFEQKTLNSIYQAGVREEEAATKAAKPQIRQTANHNPYVVNLNATDPSQRVTDLFGNPISPAKLAQMERTEPKTPFDAEMRAFDDSNPNASSIDRAKFAQQVKLNDAVNTEIQRAQIQRQTNAINLQNGFNKWLKEQELLIGTLDPIKRQKLQDFKDQHTLTSKMIGANQSLLDNDQSSPTYLKVKQMPIWADAQEALRTGKVIQVPTPLINKIAHARSILNTFKALDQAAAQVFPSGQAGPVSTFIQNKWLGLARSIAVTSGDADTAKILQDPNLIVAELAPFLGSTSRALAVSEARLLTGNDYGMSKKSTSVLDTQDINAIIPKIGVDTGETYENKKALVKSIIQSQLDQYSIKLPDDEGGPLIAAPSETTHKSGATVNPDGSIDIP